MKEFANNCICDGDQQPGSALQCLRCDIVVLVYCRTGDSLEFLGCTWRNPLCTVVSYGPHQSPREECNSHERSCVIVFYECLQIHRGLADDSVLMTFCKIQHHFEWNAF